MISDRRSVIGASFFPIVSPSSSSSAAAAASLAFFVVSFRAFCAPFPTFGFPRRFFLFGAVVARGASVLRVGIWERALFCRGKERASDRVRGGKAPSAPMTSFPCCRRRRRRSRVCACVSARRGYPREKDEGSVVRLREEQDCRSSSVQRCFLYLFLSLVFSPTKMLRGQGACAATDRGKFRNIARTPF